MGGTFAYKTASKIRDLKQSIYETTDNWIMQDCDRKLPELD